MAAALRQATDRFGALDVLFSNAGISGAITPITQYPTEEFRRVLDVHVLGAFLMLKHGLPVLRDGWSVIITSSVVGLTSDAGISGYATAKHAQVGLMRTAAKEAAARGIRVNTIHPGPTDTAFQRDIETAATGAPADAGLPDHLMGRNVRAKTSSKSCDQAIFVDQTTGHAASRMVRRNSNAGTDR